MIASFHIHFFVVLDVLQIDSGLDILYNEADNLGITVNSYVSIFE